MHKRGKLLGWLHSREQRDLAAMRETLRGSNALGKAELDALRFHELEEAFAVSAHVAIDFGQRGKVFAFGLTDVKHIHAPETVQRALRLIRVGILLRLLSLILFAFVSDHRSENENAFFATPDEAAKRSRSAVSCNVRGIGLLPRNQHDVAEAVVAKFGHGSEILREECTLPRLQRLHQVIDSFFGFEVDFF